jgi:hypothetical protein
MPDYGNLRSALQNSWLPMDRFVCKENIKHYRELLSHAKSESERQRIRSLLDEELKKEKAAERAHQPRWGQQPEGPRPLN